MYKKILFLTFLSVLLVQCSGSESEDSDNTSAPAAYDRAKMLVHWADKIILPSHTAFQSDLNDLSSKTNVFTDDPNQSNLENLRISWIKTYKSWQHIEMFDIGKAEEIYYKSKMNVYPVDESWINNNISSGNYDLDNANNYSSQGLPAVDYLLNGIAESDSEIINKFTSTENYKNYLKAIVNKMISNTNSVVNDWSTYRSSFVGSTANTASSSVNKLTNDFIYYYEKGLRANKVGIPAGVFSGSPLAQNVEAYHKEDISKALLLEAMEAAIKFYNGTSFDGLSSGPSLKGYLTHLNSTKGGSSLSALVATKLESAKSKINELPDSFISQINTDNSKMLLTYDAIQAVVVLLKVDMLQAFNINVDYQDADGD